MAQSAHRNRRDALRVLRAAAFNVFDSLGGMMSRLRVRVELNSRKAGVPLRELVGVVEETRKFFHLLAEDVQIAADPGDWLASDFDPASLQFTAEYNGHVSPEQVRSFGDAFGGSTSLRRETIAQFTHIADFIEEDELVGFGLFRSEQESEPSEWRCLSRRDALRFADEVHLLAKAAGQSEVGAALPSANGSVQGRRLFKGKRERESLTGDASWGLRELEADVSKRIGLLETQVQAHARRLQTIGTTPEATDEKLRQILGAMESFWNQAPRQLQLAAPVSATVTPSVDEGGGSGGYRLTRNVWGLVLVMTVVILTLACLGSYGIGREFARRAKGQPAGIPVVQTPGAGVVPAAEQKTASSPPPSTDAAKTLVHESDVLPAAPVLALKSQATARLIEPQVIHEIALEIPRDLRESIKSEVHVDVTAAVDDVGHVSDVRLTSVSGAEAQLVVPEALRAARQLRFQPAREGKSNVRSKVAISFSFMPEQPEF